MSETSRGTCVARGCPNNAMFGALHCGLDSCTIATPPFDEELAMTPPELIDGLLRKRETQGRRTRDHPGYESRPKDPPTAGGEREPHETVEYWKAKYIEVRKECQDCEVGEREPVLEELPPTFGCQDPHWYEVMGILGEIDEHFGQHLRSDESRHRRAHFAARLNALYTAPPDSVLRAESAEAVIEVWRELDGGPDVPCKCPACQAAKKHFENFTIARTALGEKPDG